LASGLANGIIVRSGDSGARIVTDGGVAIAGNEPARENAHGDIFIAQNRATGFTANPYIPSAGNTDAAIAAKRGIERTCDRCAGIRTHAGIAGIRNCRRRAGAGASIGVLRHRIRGRHHQHSRQRQNRSRRQESAAACPCRRRRDATLRPMQQRISCPSSGAFAGAHP